VPLWRDRGVAREHDEFERAAHEPAARAEGLHPRSSTWSAGAANRRPRRARLTGTDDAPPVPLTPDEQSAIAASKAAAALDEFATDEQVRAVWAKHGL
jgi:hypothetical protein